MQRANFDDTLMWADALSSFFCRPLWLQANSTMPTLSSSVPTACFAATQPPSRKAFLLFLVTARHWSNLLWRTIATQQLISAERVSNVLLIWNEVFHAPIRMLFGYFSIVFCTVHVHPPTMALSVFSTEEPPELRPVQAPHHPHASLCVASRRFDPAADQAEDRAGLDRHLPRRPPRVSDAASVGQG